MSLLLKNQFYAKAIAISLFLSFLTTSSIYYALNLQTNKRNDLMSRFKGSLLFTKSQCREICLEDCTKSTLQSNEKGPNDVLTPDDKMTFYSCAKFKDYDDLDQPDRQWIDVQLDEYVQMMDNLKLGSVSMSGIILVLLVVFILMFNIDIKQKQRQQNIRFDQLLI